MLSSTALKIIPIAIAATASFVLSPLCCRLAPVIGAMDVPADGRRMHSIPIPRIGGLALFPAIFIALALMGSPLLNTMLIGGSIIFAAGVTDDILGLSPAGKLTAQSLSAILTLIIGGELLLPERATPIQLALAFLWVLTLTNAFNLIDGLDGLCSGVSLAASFFIFATVGSAEATVILAALIGFLPTNRHPAAAFLGDSGAMLLGFLVSVLTLPMLLGGHGIRGMLSILAVFAYPLFDTLSAFLRRVLEGRSPFSPDRLHLHHRLADSGVPHGRASFLLVALSAALGCVGALIFYSGASLATLACVCLLIFSFICLIPMTHGGRR